MEKRTELDTIGFEITEEGFVAKLKKWPECTRTPPLGINMGHYLALIKPHNVPLDSE
jgi:hypothetical protein